MIVYSLASDAELKVSVRGLVAGVKDVMVGCVSLKSSSFLLPLTIIAIDHCYSWSWWWSSYVMQAWSETEDKFYSFFHSFIMEIYIAPLQGYYSEALPIPALLKRTVLGLEYNVSE